MDADLRAVRAEGRSRPSSCLASGPGFRAGARIPSRTGGGRFLFPQCPTNQNEPEGCAGLATILGADAGSIGRVGVLSRGVASDSGSRIRGHRLHSWDTDTAPGVGRMLGGQRPGGVATELPPKRITRLSVAESVSSTTALGPYPAAELAQERVSVGTNTQGIRWLATRGATQWPAAVRAGAERSRPNRSGRGRQTGSGGEAAAGRQQSPPDWAARR